MRSTLAQQMKSIHPSGRRDLGRKNTTRIMEEDWDTLIILDACRYDFFEKLYADYLPSGKLEKRISQGCCTEEWLKNTFTGKYAITYISANPFVNSYGLSLNQLHKRYKYSWKATEHFSKIIDVWNFGWDENLCTVPPTEVSKAYYYSKDDNRKIIHYLQPHGPYLSCDYDKSMGEAQQRVARYRARSGGNMKSGGRNEGISYLFRELIGRMAVRVLGMENIWRLRERLGMEPQNPFYFIWRKEGIHGIRYYYEDNLRRVLESVSRLTDELEGRIVITADHGEALGEGGCFGHRLEARTAVLLEVPWLVIEKPRRAESEGINAERENVKGRITNLKRLGKI